MTRTGKIARLPLAIREQLNARLLEGELGCDLVDWLNSLPEVRAILAAEFGGSPINEPNLSAWKDGGYEDWLARQDSRAWIARLVEDAASFKSNLNDCSASDLLAIPVAITLGNLIERNAVGALHNEDQTRIFLAAARELSRLRRSDHAERLLQIKELYQASSLKNRERGSSMKANLASLNQKLNSVFHSIDENEHIEEREHNRRVKEYFENLKAESGEPAKPDVHVGPAEEEPSTSAKTTAPFSAEQGATVEIPPT